MVIKIYIKTSARVDSVCATHRLYASYGLFGAFALFNQNFAQ